MRYTPDHKEKAREKLLKLGGALIKEKGFNNTGLDAIMAAAGMTTGAFYSQFSSKSDFFATLIEYELNKTLKLFDVSTESCLVAAFQKYLSIDHVNHPESGCIVTVLSNEIARADQPTKKIFEDFLVKISDQIDFIFNDEQKTLSFISQAVGAITLSRAVYNPELSQKILRANLNQIMLHQPQ